MYGSPLSGEEWNVAVLKGLPLGGNRPPLSGVLFESEPQSIEMQVAVKCVAQQIRMKALLEQNAVGSGRPKNDTQFVVGEPGQKSMRKYELLPMLHHQAVCLGESRND